MTTSKISRSFNKSDQNLVENFKNVASFVVKQLEGTRDKRNKVDSSINDEREEIIMLIS